MAHNPHLGICGTGTRGLHKLRNCAHAHKIFFHVEIFYNFQVSKYRKSFFPLQLIKTAWCGWFTPKTVTLGREADQTRLIYITCSMTARDTEWPYHKYSKTILLVEIETLQINRGNNFPALSKWYSFFNCFLRGAIYTKANLKIFHGHDDVYLFNPKTAKNYLLLILNTI